MSVLKVVKRLSAMKQSVDTGAMTAVGALAAGLALGLDSAVAKVVRHLSSMRPSVVAGRMTARAALVLALALGGATAVKATQVNTMGSSLGTIGLFGSATSPKASANHGAPSPDQRYRVAQATVAPLTPVQVVISVVNLDIQQQPVLGPNITDAMNKYFSVALSNAYMNVASLDNPNLDGDPITGQQGQVGLALNNTTLVGQTATTATVNASVTRQYNTTDDNTTASVRMTLTFSLVLDDSNTWRIDDINYNDPNQTYTLHQELTQILNNGPGQ